MGDQLEVLKNRQKDEKIDNVDFKGRAEKKFIPYITSKANANFAHNDASYLVRFGSSSNKLFEYLASGRSLLFDFECKYNPGIQGNAGIEVTSRQIDDIAATIDEISQKNIEDRGA